MNDYIGIFIMICGGVFGFIVGCVTVLYIFRFDEIIREKHIVKQSKIRHRKPKQPRAESEHVSEIKNRLSNKGDSWIDMNLEMDNVDAKEYTAKKRKELDKAYKYAKRGR